MDSLDVAILKMLQDNSRLSTEAMGEHVGLSATACQRRIKKLKQSGVIKKEVAILDGEKLGNYLTVIVDITLVQGGKAKLEKFMHAFRDEACVQQMYYLAGDLDFSLIVIVANMAAFDAFAERLLLANENIKKFTSKVVIRSEKVGAEIPLS